MNASDKHTFLIWFWPYMSVPTHALRPDVIEWNMSRQWVCHRSKNIEMSYTKERRKIGERSITPKHFEFPRMSLHYHWVAFVLRFAHLHCSACWLKMDKAVYFVHTWVMWIPLIKLSTVPIRFAFSTDAADHLITAGHGVVLSYLYISMVLSVWAVFSLIEILQNISFGPSGR